MSRAGSPGTLLRGHRARLLVAALLAAAVVATLALSTGGDRAAPFLRVVVHDGLVLVSGSGFGPSATAVVTARSEEGSAAVQATTTQDGTIEVAFRPPVGATGDVRVSAAVDGVRAVASVASVGAGGASTGLPDAGDGEPAAVPMTGAPAAVTVAPATSGLQVHRVPAGVAGDCSVDVTEAMNAWLRSVPDGSQVEFAPGGCYRVDGSLALDDRHDLVIEGNGATVRAGVVAPAGTNRAQWYVQYGSDITLRDMTLVGVNPEARFDVDHEWDHNVFVRGTHTVTVENVHGRNTYGDFIAIAQGADGTTIPSDITIRDVSADTIGRMGISCVACDGVSVSGSVFNDIAYHVFDLEIQGDDWPGRDVTYTGNTIGRHGWAFFSVGTPFQTHRNDLSNVRIDGNTMTMPGSDTENCAPAISFRSSKIHAETVTITDNTLLSHGDAIMVGTASDVTIRGNSARLAGRGCNDPVGIRAVHVEGLDLRGNTVIGYPTARRVE